MINLSKFFDTFKSRSRFTCVIQCCVTVPDADDLRTMQPLIGSSMSGGQKTSSEVSLTPPPSNSRERRQSV